MQNKFKLIILGGVFLVVIIYFLIGNFFYNLAINARSEKKFLRGNPNFDNKNKIDGREKALRVKDQNFIDSNEAQKIDIVSRDKAQLRLYGDLYENELKTNKWAILVHGYSANRKSLKRYIRNFYDKGYNVLIPDLRGHGESQGDYIGMGWDDRLDIVSWIDEIVKMDREGEIVLWGISMGATTVMNVSGEDLVDNVKVIVEDCGFNSTGDILTYQLKELFGLPKFPVIYAANSVTKIRGGYDIFKSDASRQLAKNKIPILFIHGDEDRFVPFEMLDIVYNSTKGEREKLVVEGAKHGHAEMVSPDLYWSSIWTFVDRYIE